MKGKTIKNMGLQISKTFPEIHFHLKLGFRNLNPSETTISLKVKDRSSCPLTSLFYIKYLFLLVFSLMDIQLLSEIQRMNLSANIKKALANTL